MKKISAILLALLTYIIFPQDQFTEQTSISLIGVYKSSVAWGDYDNDGDLDILLTGFDGSNGISRIYRNDGNNTFTEMTSMTLTDVAFSSVAWGDYDNNGDLDILLSGYDNGGYSVSKIYRNNGDNTFAEQTSISLTGVYYSSVAWGDYNNDGYLDILLTGNGISKIYQNNRNNSFTEQISITLPGVSNSSIAWGDYDNDGDLDIILTGFDGSSRITKIFRNNGDNSFTDQSSIIFAGYSQGSVAWGDYDNDGDLDLLLAGAGGSTDLHRNNGDNTFTAQASFPFATSCSIVWGDYDNDGDLDILLTGSGISKIFRNDGDNTFTEQTSISLIGVYYSSATWGDYDNDGDLDILLTGYDGSNPVSKIYRNNNITANTTPSVPTNLSSVVNENDVTFSWNKSTDTETPQNGLKYNLVIGTSPNAVNTFSPMSDRSTGYRRVINLGNTNHNNSWTIKGLPYGDYYWSVQAVDNVFAGSNFAPEKRFAIPEVFTEQTSISLTGVHSGSIAWGDYDNDGDLDILIIGDTGGYTASTKLFQNNAGTFSAVSTSIYPCRFGTVDWGDYDNDGDLDVLLTGFNSGNISRIYRNDGGNVFTDINAGLTPLTYSCGKWGDYDNDGDLDVLITGGSGGENPTSKIYRNDNGTFTDISANLIPALWSAAAWGDYDNDGDLDIVITGAATWAANATTSIYRNDGNAVFTNINAGLIGVYYSSVAWGDYDNDGDLDLMLAGWNQATNTDVAKVYRNDNGIFTDISAGLTGVRSCSMAWGDYDNDGDLDILLSGYDESVENVSEIYRNEGNNTFTKQTSIILESVSSSSVAWGDYDNDGDLDILLIGANPNGVFSKIYRNNHLTPNTIPNVPSNLASSIIDNQVILSWNKSTDAETPQNGLKYNIVIGSITGGIDKVSPMSDRNTGYRKIVNSGNTNHSNDWAIKGLPAGNYYWSVQSIDNNFSGSGFANEQSFRVTHFAKNWINLYQPMNIYVTSAVIDGIDLDAGDEIAVFDGTNCVGIVYLDSPIPSGGYIPILLSADDPTTPEIDGFISGNIITYRFWDAERTSEINRMTANYSQGVGVFQPLESSTVSLSGIYTINQIIDLRTGWSIFSLRGTPDNISMLQLLNPLISSGVLVKVQDERGFAVEQLPPPIGWINNIGNWASSEGYYIKLNSLSALSITGPPISLPFNIPLNVGWNIISYPVDIEQNALTLVNSLIISNQLIKIQDEDGNAVEKLPIIGWINNIGNFESGEGYYMKVNAGTNLIFEPPIVTPLIIIDELVKESKQHNKNLYKPTANHFLPIYSSPYLPMNIYVTGVNLSGGISLGTGDEIGIFDGEYCVGSIVLTGPIGTFVSMIASTDDPGSAVRDGFIQGHTISYKFWLNATSTEITNYNLDYSLGDGTFVSQGTAVVSFENVLPVELTTFYAKVYDNKINLKWTTATEVNNYGFEVERKSNSDWQKIGFVAGQGTSNSQKEYSYIDQNPLGAINSYTG